MSQLRVTLLFLVLSGICHIPLSFGDDMVLEVIAKRNRIQNDTTASTTELSHQQITELPQGETADLPTLIAETTPGVTSASMGTLLFHGAFGKIQWRIDGIQLPDSPDNSLGEEFSAKNIENLKIIMGGFPAEFGDRLSAVVDVTSKSGTEDPHGLAEINYGSYNTTSPFLLYSGSSASGLWHYFISTQYNRTDRGLNTPEPVSSDNINNGGTDAVHDQSHGANAFVKADYQMDNENKLIFILSESYKYFQIPNFPSNFAITDPLFNSNDAYGNTPYIYTPSNTNDTQTQNNAFFEAAWKRTLSNTSFLQIAPFYKYTYTRFDNDPANDLFSVTGPSPINGATAGSFFEARHVNNFGVQADLTDRLSETHSFKTGVRVQASQASGDVAVTAATTGSPAVYTEESSTNTGYTESVYAQDDISLSKKLVLNVGLRLDAVQNHFSDASPSDAMLQPRIGLNYLLAESTKLHAFYGKFFQPAPLEDFRDSFSATQPVSGDNCPPGQLCPYDIKPEKDDYAEVGIAQQLGDHLIALKGYYRWSHDELDDTQLLNTNILQPVNYAVGHHYGVDLAVSGRIDAHWSDYLNYSYSIARVRGISGGIFGVGPSEFPSDSFVALDEEQIHTANAALTYNSRHFWWTGQELFGSGLHTGPNNVAGLPSHFSTNMTFGYDFSKESWLSKTKLSLDILNAFNNIYVISLANDFNANHFAAQREFIVHLSKEL